MDGGPTGSGFHGTAGAGAMRVDAAALASVPAASSLPSLPHYSSVVLDIEGCTTAISFVSDILFPYASQHAHAWLSAHWGEGECTADVGELVKQSEADVAVGVEGAAGVPLGRWVVDACVGGVPQDEAARAQAAVLANVAWQMGLNRKTGGLKQLQGHIWRDGYSTGALKGHVYEDTVPALAGWGRAGKKVYIYSSGSREAQRLLFKHSVGGDVRGLLCGYFDTTSGPKVEAASYTSIAATLGVDTAGEVLFVTDALAEAVAAAHAGMRVVLTDRPGNAPLPAGHPFPVVTSLLQLVAQ